MAATSIVKSSWFKLHPNGRMDATFWTAVLNEAMPALLIDAKTATDADVTRAIGWIILRATSDKRNAKAKRDAAALLLQEASMLETRSRAFA